MDTIFTQSRTILIAGNSKETTLKDILSQSGKTLFYFYPKNDTPGCTLENTDFTSLKSDFESLWIQLIWVSKDTIESHQKFCGKYGLQNPLISDSDLELHHFFGAYGEKNNYGKIVQGVIRSTFLLDKEGNILQSWKNVKATRHAQKILKELS